MRSLATIILLSVGTLAVIVGVAAYFPSLRPMLPPRVDQDLGAVKAWGYQLQKVKAQLIPDDVDLLVVDYSRDGSGAAAFAASEVETLRRRADGRRRIVLCYLSIGEAEVYRYYWQPYWTALPPSWLGRENPTWKGNFAVQFWHPNWQRIIVQPQMTMLSRFLEWAMPSRAPYIDRILEAGFDGVYLDRVDAFASVEPARSEARWEMIGFVKTISAYARQRKAGFLIVAQNAEELLEDGGYRTLLDGVAKEDLFFGEGGDGVDNDPRETRETISRLNRLKADGRPVFVVEYVSDAEKRAATLRQLDQLGYVGLFADRKLSAPPVVAGTGLP